MKFATFSGLAMLLGLITSAVAADAAADAQKILAAAGVKGGLVVHLACGDGRLTAALRASDAYLVQGLDADRANVARARQHIQSLGLYGPVSVEQFSGRRLPYSDNLINLLVAESSLADLPMDEVMRALAPQGVAYVRQAGKWQKTVKPRPNDIDEWTHYLHGSDNNAVAADLEVGPPKHARWIAPPLWSRSHEYNPSLNAAVSSAGRLIYTLDEGIAGIHDSPKFRLPERWSLVARDAFSGVLLWKRPIPNWGHRQWNTVGMWSAPLTLQRRLVANGDRVYFTFGYKAPVTVLDAATGQTLRTIEGTDGTDELLLCDGVLLLCVRDQLSVGVPPQPADETAKGAKANAQPARSQNPGEYTIGKPGPGSIVAVDAKTGKQLWRRPAQPVLPVTLASDGRHVCFHDSDQVVVCLDFKSGQQRWTAACDSPKGSRNTGGTLVMHDGVVLFTGAKGLDAFSAEDGTALWSGPKVSGPGITNPPDLFVANGLVWGGDTAGTNRATQTAVRREGLDPKSGKVDRTVEVAKLFSPGHHVRCYRSKATDRFLLLTKRGVEFFDIQGDDFMRDDWLRAGCSYGFLPCNGLLYVTPHHCFCYPGVKMNGFLALSSKEAADDHKPEQQPALERGPAYGAIAKGEGSAASDDWPTYRHDATRSGSLGRDLAPRVTARWQKALGGRLSQPVVAQGRLFVAQVDAHTIHALDATDGHTLWSYTADARIDSPPTIFEGKCLFGCRDGRVYCLRGEDGAVAWRYRVAPADRRMVAFDQLESPWPVPGSVLVQNGVAYAAAGRSSFLDGGVYLVGLDPSTGELLHEHRIDGPWPNPAETVGRPFDMEGAKGDILVGDGRNIYLFQMVFDNQLKPQEAPRLANLGARKVGLHLMSTGGLVDYDWYDRTYWTYSRLWPGFYYANAAPKAGQILAFDDKTVYGLHVFTSRLRLSPAFAPGGKGPELFADDVNNEPELTENSAPKEKGPGFSRAAEPKWSHHIPVCARAMVLAGKTLFIAGPPDVVPANDSYAALDGRAGAKLWAVDTADGNRLAELDLKSPPVYDGMSAAAGRLYLSTTTGEVLCLGK